MSLLLHISDTHFGTEDAKVTQALRSLVHEHGPDALVLSGDITQRARTREFAAARAFCESLRIGRMLALPGNHDIPLGNVFARLFDPYGKYKAAFGDALEPELMLPDVLLVGVNTTRPTRHKDGEVSSEQIARVGERLAGIGRGTLRIVVTHQPAWVLRQEDETDRLHGGPQALQAWAAAGADLVLGGHIHLPYVADMRELVPATPRPLYCVQAGTAVSTRVRHNTPNSVNLIEWSSPAAADARVCGVQRWDYDVADGRFELTHSHALRLGE